MSSQHLDKDQILRFSMTNRISPVLTKASFTTGNFPIINHGQAIKVSQTNK